LNEETNNLRQNGTNPKGIESISPALKHPPPLRFGEARKRLRWVMNRNHLQP
jgi:hypothetical protein